MDQEARTSRSRPATLASAREWAAAAVLGPLSGQRAGGGAGAGGAGGAPRGAARGGPLAATPPERRTLRASNASAARTVFLTRTSTTAAWKAAAMSATGAPASWAARATAVLRA